MIDASWLRPSMEYLRKGSSAYFEGLLKTRKWTYKTGLERYTTEIEVNELQLLGRPDSPSESVKRVVAAGETVVLTKTSYQPHIGAQVGKQGLIQQV